MRKPHVLLLFFLFFIVTPCLGQSTASIQGTVTDPGGAVIPGADVLATQQSTGLKRTAVTDETGTYTLNFLPVGVYSVEVSLPGFKKAQQNNVQLEIGQSRTIDLELELGGITEVVEVVDTAPPLDRSSPEIGTVVGKGQLDELPLNGRHWAALMMLAPGAVNTGRGDHTTIRFAGRARDDNNWTFDGVDSTGVKDPRQESSVRLIVSMESISEFRVSSSLYSAEHGGGAGGHVALVSKGGTNEFHGGLFEYHRNDLFDARVFTDPGDLPPFRLNQFGGNFGGPIVKDKTFFFGSYEGLRQRQGQTFRDFVPSAAFKQQVLAVSPELKPIVDAYPAGTLSTSDPDIDEAVSERFLTAREDALMFRLDHRFSDDTSMYGRFSMDDTNNKNPKNVGIALEETLFRPWNFALQLQRVFSPTLINEVKLGVNRAPMISLNTGPIPGQVRVDVPGFMRIERNQDVVEAGTSIAILDNLAIIRSRHNLKIGGEYRRVQVNVGEGEPVSLGFSSRDNFINNRLESFNIAPFPVVGGRRNYIFGYMQDDFKWRPNLTLNMGVRYEYYSVPYEVNGRARVWRMECGGFCPEGTSWYDGDFNNFAPRLGLAWAPEKFNNKTVIRAGYGVYFGPGQVDDVYAPIDSTATRISLDSGDAPGLNYPIDPWISLAETTGETPRALYRNRRELYNQSYGLSIQQTLPASFVMQVGYLGGQAHKLNSRSYTNNIDPATGKRALPAFSKIDIKGSESNSNFHGFQVSLHRQMVAGFLVGSQYMWSHSRNDGTTGGGESQAPQNVSDRRSNWARSNEDIRHTITTNWIYKLPFGAGRTYLNEGNAASKIFGGWELGGIAQARTGKPITISVSRSSKDLPDRNSSAQRPDRVEGVPLTPPGGSTADQWINPAAFAMPAPGTWGTAGRNIMSGPSMVQFDMSLARVFDITEGKTIEFRAEAFNIFNRASYGQPNSNFSSGVSFGRITEPFNRTYGTGTNRQMQFMVRFTF